MRSFSVRGWGFRGRVGARAAALGLVAVTGLLLLALPGAASAKRGGMKLEKAKHMRVVSSPLKVEATFKRAPRKVSFAIGGRRLYVATTAPYRLGGPEGGFDATTLRRGTHRLIVRAYFGEGLNRRARSSSVVRVVKRRVRAAGATTVRTTVYTDLPRATRSPAAAASTPPAPAATAAAASTQTLISLLRSDMSQPSELRPALNVNWANAPISRGLDIPSNFGSVTAWGVLDNAASGNPQPGAKVHIASIETWIRSRSQGRWVQLQAVNGVVGGEFYDNNWSGATRSSGQTASPDGGTSIGGIPGGYNFHFFPTSRASFPPGDVAGVVVLIRARLQPGTYDASRPLPAFALCAAVDWWLTSTAPWRSDYSNNRDGGIGRFKRVDRDMRLYTMSAGDLSTLPPVSVAPAEIR